MVSMGGNSPKHPSSPRDARYAPHPPLSPGRQQLNPLDQSLKSAAPRSATSSPRSSLGSHWVVPAAPSSPTGEVVRHAQTAYDQHPPISATALGQSDNIKVAVRVRPLLPAEQDKGGSSVLAVSDDYRKLKVVVGGPAGATMQREFLFDACLGPEVGQEEVLRLCGINQLLDAALSGYNVTVFAHGQTGSGKTYTMSGREEGLDGEAPHDGVVLRGVKYLFQQAAARQDAKWSIAASYLEIYNEGVFDLLNFDKRGLPVKWDAGRGFYVPGLKTVACSGVKSMIDVLQTGANNRRVGSHELNMESSRSHAMISIHCNATPTDPTSYDYGTVRYGKVCFVDLAGSERLKDSKCEGSMLKETNHINKSLFTLGKVISALSDQAASGNTGVHIPYRDSKLTKLLMDSLGGSALALMIACCSPSSAHIEETLSTLSYATRAKNIQNRPIVQHDPKAAQISLLRREIELLRHENLHLREQLQLRPLLAPGGSQPAPSCVPTSPNREHGAWSHVNVDLPAKPHTAGALPHTASGTQHAAHADSTAWELAAAASPASPGRASSRLGSAWNMSSATTPSNGGPAEEPWSRDRLGDTLRVMSQPQLLRPPELLHAVHAARSTAADSTSADTELLRRLRNTEVLLGRFSEENSRLARENDRLRTGRQLLGSEQANMLDEIEMLRGQLGNLESAVLADMPGVREAAQAVASGMRELGAGLDSPQALESHAERLFSHTNSQLSVLLPSGASRSGTMSPQPAFMSERYAASTMESPLAFSRTSSALGGCPAPGIPAGTSAISGIQASHAGVSSTCMPSPSSSKQATRGAGEQAKQSIAVVAGPSSAPQVVANGHTGRKPSLPPAKMDDREPGAVIVADHAKLMLLLGSTQGEHQLMPSSASRPQSTGQAAAAAMLTLPPSPLVQGSFAPSVVKSEALGGTARRTSYVEIERVRRELSVNGGGDQLR